MAVQLHAFPNVRSPRVLALVLVLLGIVCASRNATAEPATTAQRQWPQQLQDADAMRSRSPADARRMTAVIRGSLQATPDPWLEAMTHLIDCLSLIEQDGVMADEAAQRGLKLVTAGQWPHETGRLELCRFLAAEYVGEIPKAQAGYDSVVREAEMRGDKELWAEALLRRGELKAYQGEYAEGLSELNSACGFYEKQGDSPESLYCIQAMGAARFRAEDYDGAIRLLRKVIAADEAAGRTYALADATYYLARAEDGAGDLKAARADFGRTMELFRQIDDTTGMAYARFKLGALLVRLQEPELALKHLDAALATFQQIQDADGAAQIQIQRARALVLLNRFTEARAALVPALAEHARSNQLPAVEEGYELLSDLERDSGNRIAALDALRNAFKTHKKLDLLHRDKDMARLRIQYDAEKKDQENRLLLTQQELNRTALDNASRIHNLQQIILVLAAALLVIAAWAMLRQWRQAQAYRVLAMTDELTGISNRRSILAYLQQTIGQARERHRPLSVVLVDIDHFKRVNDQYGHAAGDTVLKRVASVCQGVLRNDDRIGRTGGEEFLIVLPNTSLGAAGDIAERLRRQVEVTRFEEWSPDLRAQISAGIDLWSADDQDSMAVIQRADSALYRAKKNGRNRVELGTGS